MSKNEEKNISKNSMAEKVMPIFDKIDLYAYSATCGYKGEGDRPPSSGHTKRRGDVIRKEREGRGPDGLKPGR